jgi:hypothetical protein
MKLKTRILQILGVAAIVTMGMTSCDTDACKDVECGTYGNCIEGDCECDANYTGTNCATLLRADYIGSGNVDETCDSSTDTYALTITAGTAITDVVINNIYGLDLNTTGTVDTEGNLTIPSQTFGSGTISGTGSLTNDILTISFDLVLGTETDSCTLVSQP